MIILYIIGIIVFMCLSVFFIDLYQKADRYSVVLTHKETDIQQLNDKLDNISKNLDKKQSLISKIDNISKKALKFKK